MISRRLAALALTLLAFAGCHEDPTVVKVLVGPNSEDLTITAVGGDSSTPTLAVGTGGPGANLRAFASGEMNLGNSGSAPAAPVLPTAPTTGTELTNALITAGAPIAGNVVVSSTLQIAAGVNPAVITTNSGDVVIRGSLIAERSAGATTNAISISATAGTIYVLGSIQTAGTAGAPDNPNAGNVTLTALRIVVTGTIDARGETEGAAAGGNGGVVMLDTTAVGGGHLLFTSGQILTSGGSGTALGGNGGNVTLLAGNQLAVYAPIVADGGLANDVGVSPTGGNGGNVTLRGNGGADLVASLSMAGGGSTGFMDGARGGNGGTFAAGSAAPYRIYGSIVTRGGSSTANALGAGALFGGNAGPVDLGVGTPVSSLELGRGTYSTRGGTGNGGGGNAGTFDVASIDGDIAMGASMSARGGDCAGPGSTNGGIGGSITIRTDANPAGNLTNHSLSIPSLASLLDSGGGIPAGTGVGGAGAAVTLQCGGDLTFGGRISSAGGVGAVGSTSGSGGAVSLLLDAANTTPSGDLLVPGQIVSEAGNSSDGTNGNGNTIDLRIVKAGSLGEIIFSGTLSSVGGGNGGGGNAGIITISAITGNITLSGSISAAGRSALNAAGAGRNVNVLTAGSIVSSALINVAGGAGLNTGGAVPGGDAGNLVLTSSSAVGSITLQAGTSIVADGGASTTTALGGIGGRILISTVDQAVSLTCSISARGGPSPSGTGGLGGQVVVNSDSNGNGTGGAITLTPGSVIDVSGGTGTIGGFARNNGGVAPADSSGTLTLAVVFDADTNLTAQPDSLNGGIVQNLGRIIATGGSLIARGGDVWFDGKNALGADLGALDGGTQTITGPAGNGAFFPN